LSLTVPFPTDKKARKEHPITTGVFDYFPNALMEVAVVSFMGNQQHNPGQPLHWSRGKSNDHADTIGRHLLERGTRDDDGQRHSAKLAWRALANLQIEIEEEARDLGTSLTATEAAALDDSLSMESLRDLSPNVTFVQGQEEPQPETSVLDFTVTPEIARKADFEELTCMGCTEKVAKQVTGGITYRSDLAKNPDGDQYTYVAGPMRGYEQFNFPAFDAARDKLVRNGWNVISPADIDRASGDTNATTGEVAPVQDYVIRDFFTLLFLSYINGVITMLPGWERSTGAVAEFFLARWLGMKVLNENGHVFHPDSVNYHDLNAAVERFLLSQWS